MRDGIATPHNRLAAGLDRVADLATLCVCGHTGAA
jgi:hypothetical protein